MKPIAVVGCQRSGTSIVAGILFKSGIFMGNWFLKKDKFNPTGYFEDTEFGNLDEDRWKGALSEDLWKEKVAELAQNRQQEVEQNPSFPRWGWKSPASSLFIQDYKEICDPLIIWCKRDKEDTIESMKKMYWQNGEQQYQNKTETLQDIETLQVDFNNLIENTNYEVGRIMGYINHTPPPQKLKKALNHIVKPPNLEKQETEHYQDYL